MPEQVVVIQASHWNQALAIARELGLPKPDGHRHGDTIAIFADDHRRICATEPTRLIFARQRVELTMIDRINHDDCRLHLRMRFMRGLARRGFLKGDTDYERRKYVDSLIEWVDT